MIRSLEMLPLSFDKSIICAPKPTFFGFGTGCRAELFFLLLANVIQALPLPSYSKRHEHSLTGVSSDIPEDSPLPESLFSVPTAPSLPSLEKSSFEAEGGGKVFCKKKWQELGREQGMKHDERDKHKYLKLFKRIK